MAWNRIDNKSINPNGTKGATIPPGAPISTNPSFQGHAYKDPWDIERAYREGMQKVTWVSRCIDAIAGNQARLPIILRKDNSPDGEVVTKKQGKSAILDILNTKSNIGENSFIFRYRLSSQLLLGTRGVFIEKLRGRDGALIGLNLLPPQSTSPIPDPRLFVSGYEVNMSNGDKIIMKPDDVIWIRRPHPLDPYLSMTPMESAGIAIEIENLAKLYNRNFLLNDGRPGGLLVLRGEIDEDDKEELRSRFRGNMSRVGTTTVVSADDGVDYVDTSSNPRDAAYIQMRQITKEEILASFGVPESVIGNAAGRTFNNASEEVSVFWNETMSPHLEVLARALDELDDKHYIDFDISNVPYLILAKQERERYLMQELQAGLISPNEYRDGTGRKKVESDLADSLLMNPNLTPIANTTKPMPPAPGQGGMPVPGMPGMPPGVPGMPGMPPGAEGMPPGAELGGPGVDPNTMAGALAEESGMLPPGGMPGMPGMPPGAPAMPPGAPGGFGQMSDPSEMQFKDELFEKDTDLARWVEILDRSLERIFERQQRVVIEKVAGQKSRKLLMSGSLDVDTVMPMDTWNKQMDEDIKPVLSAIVKDAQTIYSTKSAGYSSPSQNDLLTHLESQMERIKSRNTETQKLIAEAIYNSYGIRDEEQRASGVRSSINAIFTDILAKRRPDMAINEARRAWNFPRPL
jgi:HK97 family phage portal protein